MADAVVYVARCEPCDYTGPERGSNLTALRDFDRHAERTAHAIAVLEAEVPGGLDHTPPNDDEPGRDTTGPTPPELLGEVAYGQ